MPHYKNNREAKEGEHVIYPYDTWVDGETVLIYRCGVIHTIRPGATSCNAQVATPQIGGCQNYCVTVGNCLRADDAFAAFERKEFLRGVE